MTLSGTSILQRKQTLKVLKMIRRAATKEKLQQAFYNHKEQTEEHVSRLEQAFEIIGDQVYYQRR